MHYKSGTHSILYVKFYLGSLDSRSILFVGSESMCSPNINRTYWTHLDKSSTTRQEAQLVVTDTKAQKDIFSLDYRPTLQEYKTRPTRYLKTYCNKKNSTYKQSENTTGSSNGLLPTGDILNNKSGRVSQLANRVEHLLIQDSTNTLDRYGKLSSVPDSEKQDSLESCLLSSTKRKQNNLISSSITTTISSPWYRHCRPKAPPPVFPLSSENYAMKCCQNEGRDFNFNEGGSKSSDDHLEFECENLFTPLPCLISTGFSCSVRCPSIQHLETDLSQENINWDSDYPQPPPFLSPDDVESTPMNHSYSFSFPPNSIIDEESSTFSAAVPYSEEVTLKPLAPITNILPNGGAFIRRHPKWAMNCNSNILRLHPTVRFSDSNLTIDSDFHLSSSSSSSPSAPSPPPPLIVQRLPCELADNLSEPQEQQHSICSPTLNKPNLTRPIVLKRGAPDSSVEQISNDIIGLDVKKDCDPPLKMKRNLYWDLTMEDYSPKKSRIQLLVPSECSAFLPVRSTRQLDSKQHLNNISSPSLR
ncbi:unnamed protein product [Schistosoma turkestanicum]|nr:unnamed protein product [Schistosoma turkestanicum]